MKNSYFNSVPQLSEVENVQKEKSFKACIYFFYTNSENIPPFGFLCFFYMNKDNLEFSFFFLFQITENKGLIYL